MNRCVPVLLTVCALAVAASAGAAHRGLEACGGMAANAAEGVRDDRFASPELERRIEAFLKGADALPGAAIVIVKDESIVLARGFGFRDLSGCKRVTSDTRFYLKSTTKSFLGLAAAILHEAAEIDLDAPISDYLPGLAPPGGINPQQISLRSHFLHTQPYYSSDFEYRTSSPGNLPESEYVRFVNAHAVPRGIHSQYTNFGPIIAAHAISVHTGVGWRELIRSKVFLPGGMKSSFTSMARARKGPMAQAYRGAELSDFIAVATKTDAQMHPAGGSVSTAADLGRFLILNLNGGRIDGVQAVPRRAVEQAHARQTQLDWTFSEFRRFAHGLGFYSADYDGNLLVHHFGGETHVSFMPERGFGVAVLTNEIDSGVVVTHRLAATIYDSLLGSDDIDRRILRRLREIEDAKRREVNQTREHLMELRDTAPAGSPSYSADALAGRYSEAGLGEISVRNGPDGLSLSYGALSGMLTPAGENAYVSEFQMWGAPPELIVFRKDPEHGVVLDWDGRSFLRQSD